MLALDSLGLYLLRAAGLTGAPQADQLHAAAADDNMIVDGPHRGNFRDMSAVTACRRISFTNEMASF
jgi:hypothetical protein